MGRVPVGFCPTQRGRVAAFALRPAQQVGQCGPKPSGNSIQYIQSWIGLTALEFSHVRAMDLNGGCESLLRETGGFSKCANGSSESKSERNHGDRTVAERGLNIYIS